MERSKLKLRHVMGIWKTLPEYPTKEDLIYEISSYLVKDGRPNGEFTTQTLNSVFGKDWNKTSIGKKIKEMLADGDFLLTDRKDSARDWYKIKDNPYY